MLSLQQALTQIPPLDSGNAPAPISGGLSNTAWRVSIGGIPHVLRLSAITEDGELRRAREFEIQQKAHRGGIAPAIVYASFADGLMLTKLAPGKALSDASFRDDEILAAVAGLLTATHALPRCGYEFDLLSAAEQYCTGCSGQRQPQANAVASLLEELLDDAPAGTVSLCHNDPVAQNFILGESLQLVDWEFAGDGDPFFDFGALSAHHSLNRHQRRLMLASSGVGDDSASLEVLGHWERVYRCIYWLWLAERASTTDEVLENLLAGTI